MPCLGLLAAPLASTARLLQPSVVTKRLKSTAEMMRPDTGLHADQTEWHIGKPGLNLATWPLLPQDNLPACVLTDNVEGVFTDIDANNDNSGVDLRYMTCSSSLAPLASLSLAGQEHGRTIPLADLGQALVGCRPSVSFLRMSRCDLALPTSTGSPIHLLHVLGSIQICPQRN